MKHNPATVGVLRQGETATVAGHAFDCAWLQVSTESGLEGWITGGAQYVTFNLTCADVSLAVIPPTPKPAISPTPLPPPASATSVAPVYVLAAPLSVSVPAPSFVNPPLVLVTSVAASSVTPLPPPPVSVTVGAPV